MVFENLVIKVKDDETSAAIFRYTLTEKGEITQTGGYTIKEIDSSVFTDLNVEGRAFFYNNSDGDTCYDIHVVRCNIQDHRPAGHIATEECFTYFMANNNMFNGSLYNSTSTICASNVGGGSSSDGSSSGGSSSNNTGGLGASGGGVSGPIVVTPITCRTGNCIEDNIVNDPCQELKRMKTNTDINADLQRLKLLIPSTKEKGASIELSTIDFTSISVIPSTSSIEYNDAIKWPTITNRIGINHIHGTQLSNYEMFGISDLYSIWKLRYNFTSNFSEIGYNLNLFFVNLTVGSDSNSESGYTYSIKIDANNTQGFNSIGNMNVLIKNKKLLDTYEEYGLPDSPGARHNLLVIPFLRVANQYGLKLFRTKTHENKWSEVIIDDNSPIGITLIPCNNQ